MRAKRPRHLGATAGRPSSGHCPGTMTGHSRIALGVRPRAGGIRVRRVHAGISRLQTRSVPLLIVTQLQQLPTAGASRWPCDASACRS